MRQRGNDSPVGDGVRWRDLIAGIKDVIPESAALGRGMLTAASLGVRGRLSIGGLIEHWAARAPDRIALRFGVTCWTYAEFNAWTNRICALLAARGIRSGDVVGILMENRPEVLASVAATVKLGAVAAMLNPHQYGNTLEHSLNLTSPRVMIVGSECLDNLDDTSWHPQHRPHVHFIQVNLNEAELRNGYTEWHHALRVCTDRNPVSTRHVSPRAPCFYIFTSGTTGLPKASVMTHYRWLAVMNGIGSVSLRLRADDVFYCCLPLYHNNALTVSWASVLGVGATLALDKKFSASRFWEQIQFHGATAFCYIGELLRYLLNQPHHPAERLHRVRIIVGNGLRPELWDSFEQRFGISRICEFYGASESNIGFINFFGVKRTAGFSPLPFAIVKFDPEAETPLRDATGRLQRVVPGGVGLLISEVSPLRPFDGYTDPSANEKKLLRDVFRVGDCWFNSGDLVRDQGCKHIQFVDRVGDTFRWKGENVSTSEVEGVLATLDTVEHAVVYGVEIPGCDGRAGMAALTLKPGTDFDGRATASHLSRFLPAYAVPLFIRLRASQDTTGTFKYRKVELKQSGFDITRIDEPLYHLLDRDRGYCPLNAEVYTSLTAGTRRP